MTKTKIILYSDSRWTIAISPITPKVGDLVGSTTIVGVIDAIWQGDVLGWVPVHH